MSEKQEGLTDEQFVRQHWREVVVERHPDCVNVCGYGPYISLEITLAAAAEFTRERLRQIEQVEEESAQLIEFIEGRRRVIASEYGPSYPDAQQHVDVFERILRREQDALAALQTGMIPAPAKETTK